MQKKLFLFFLFLCSFSLSLRATFEEYLLPESHFLQKPLAEVFKNPEILTSRESLRESGFELFKRRHSGLVVARHPKLQGYLIKVFINDQPREKQLHNYVTRIKGARALQQFIVANKIQHIITPKKWLYPVDDAITVLVVEEMNILSNEECHEAYAKIDPEVLKELCLVIRNFRGLDSILKNMPFTKEGKIAFLDTEHWTSKRPSFLRHVVPLLDQEKRHIVQMNQWNLPEAHPLQEKLATVFTSQSLFDSPDTLRAAGFEVNPRVHKGMMVFTHPELQDYIFKRYQNSTDPTYQLQKYLKRLEGASKVRELIEELQLKEIVVPQKWLYKLPCSEKDEYLVIAERFDICSGDDDKNGENVKRYQAMNLDQLRELCTIMQRLGGCDAWPRNQPFTKTGKIAFIDTEHVGHKQEHFLRHIIPLLDKEKQQYALTLSP